MPRTYALQTFGCQMNVHDSDRMEEVLRAHGWSEAEGIESADLIVFNTCSVREKAEQKLRSEVGKLAPLKRSRPELVIAVAGCVAQQEGEKLLADVRHIDLVIGPDNISELPKLVEEQVAGALPVARTVFDVSEPHFLAAMPDANDRVVTAMVTTMKGCDERCSFCIVPSTRGPERYRPASEIVGEVEKWVLAGAREVLLLGQTVDSYRDPSLPPPVSADPDETQFPHLLRMIANRVASFDRQHPDRLGLARIRYTSPHPRHATESLAQAHADVDLLAKHVHLPVQSGSDRILRRMIRRYTRREYIERTSRLVRARPGMTLSTDIIVGFPGETDEDFKATLSLVEEVGFTSAFAFKYSERPNTPSLKLKDDVSEEAKDARLAELLRLVEKQGAAHLANLVGTRAEVLILGLSKTKEGLPADRIRVQGRTERNEIVHLDVPSDRDPIGKLVDVTIARANKHSLVGVLDDGVAARFPAKTKTKDERRALPLI